MGTGILAWLDAKRSKPFPIDNAELQDFVRQVSEAFEIVSLLSLSAAALTLRQSYVRWFGWVSNLNLTSSRDAQASYFRMLATTQPAVAEQLSEPDALAPFWLRLCREAGTNYRRRYLQIGLLGLRRLPGPIERGETPWIAGLAAWALEQNPTDKEFMRAWNPIKRLHPASPKVLRKSVFNVLSQKAYSDSDIVSPGWWANDPDFPAAQSKTKFTRYLTPPPEEYWRNILRLVSEAFHYAEVEPVVEDMVQTYDRFTEATGDKYFLVRTYCQVGLALLRNRNIDSEQTSLTAERLARITLRYEPSNPIAWGLWRDALFAAGKVSNAIALGWETISRFPNDPLMRNELAEILLAKGDVDDALSVVESAIQSGACDIVTYNIAARIYANMGNEEAARDAITAGLEIEPGRHDLLHNRENLDAGKPLPLVAAARQLGYEAYPAKHEATFDLQEISRPSRLRMIRSRLGSDDSALSELQSILDEDPTFAYAQLLAARQQIWKSESVALPPVAASFEEALANADTQKLEELSTQMPKLASLILLARAILGDQAAAREVADRLRDKDGKADYRVAEILRPRFKPVFELIDGGLDPAQAVNKNAEILLMAIYDTNEALVVQELLVA